MLAANASFMVAALEAGLPFDVYPGHLVFMDVQIAWVAKENALIDKDAQAMMQVRRSEYEGYFSSKRCRASSMHSAKSRSGSVVPMR
jgi:hypothetical protein